MQNKEVVIENKKYIVDDNEFCKIEHKEYNNLRILDGLGELERIVSLICEIKCIDESIKNLIIAKIDHGGYIHTNCASTFSENIFFNCELNDNLSGSILYLNELRVIKVCYYYFRRFYHYFRILDFHFYIL
jgi:hypothetical protein